MDFKNNQICKMFQCQYPIVQAGMVWVSGAKLAISCAENGILGLIGAASMDPQLLREHCQKAKKTGLPNIGVNVPLLYSKAEEQIQTALEEGIRIFFTSAGSPKKFTKMLKKENAKVVHVCSSLTLAQKCQDAGVDAVVVEGHEAGGHNGREEMTSMVLIPQVSEKLNIPVIAAGGIVCGKTMRAALVMGAQGVQMGTRFVACQESSAHENFKNIVVNAPDTATMLMMKDLVPVRLYKNKFYEEIKKLEKEGSPEQVLNHLGKGRAKKGMFEGDLDEGEIEIGQGCSRIHDCPPAKIIIENILKEFRESKLPF